MPRRLRVSRPQLKRDPLGSKPMPARFILVPILLLLGCGRSNSSSQVAVDTTIVFIASRAPTGSGPVLRIVITRDAKVYADGRRVTSQGLDSAISALETRNGAVWYYRAGPERVPTARQDAVISLVLKAVLDHRRPLKLLSHEDLGRPALRPLTDSTRR